MEWNGIDNDDHRIGVSVLTQHRKILDALILPREKNYDLRDPMFM